MIIVNVHKIQITAIQGEEFNKCIDVASYSLFRGTQVFVLWNWTWLQDSTCPSSPGNSSNYSPDLIPETPSIAATSSGSDSDCDTIPEITHTVIFKCIGVQKERRYQEILC